MRICSFTPALYATYLRKKGVSIGEGTTFFGHNLIDTTRPCLVKIGSNCNFAGNVVLLTHGYDWAVLREKYGEVFASSGKVVIEDNVFIGTNTTILKGVRIGKNTVIGASSVVTHDIPSNSVAVGNPCKVVSGIEEYFEKRKKVYVQEAKSYALELFRSTGKVPKQEDFWEEFPIFLPRKGKWGKLPVKGQLGSAFGSFLKSAPLYKSFEAFLIDSGIPEEKIRKTTS
jgi:carbonic anhydrase/acetyltransferase-like protein (isoleucine patch superfamily)